MGILRRLETDGTYAQDDQFERIARLATNESASFDLTSATDRFPVELQRVLLSHVLGEKVAQNWVNVLTQRSFHYKTHTVR
jgi:hypothetical protein